MKISYQFEWKDQGRASLTEDGRPLLPKLPKEPGVYRMTLTRDVHSSVYIGEAEDLSRRTYNYRNPGPSQRTSLRINELLRTELTQGTTVSVATVVDPVMQVNDQEVRLDLAKKPYRLLFENAALVAVLQEGVQEIHNL